MFCRKHAVIRLASGIWSLQSRQTSGVQAICCSQVPRFSSENAAIGATTPLPNKIMKLKTMRCGRMPNPLSLKFPTRVFAWFVLKPAQ